MFYINSRINFYSRRNLHQGMEYLGIPALLRRPHAWQDQMAEIGLPAGKQKSWIYLQKPTTQGSFQPHEIKDLRF